jgi:hypothetical protein
LKDHCQRESPPHLFPEKFSQTNSVMTVTAQAKQATKHDGEIAVHEVLMRTYTILTNEFDMVEGGDEIVDEEPKERSTSKVIDRVD